jgi:hypothetical protein
MNYERFKKGIVSLALMCVLVFSMLAGGVVPANAQGYQMRYVYSYPYVYYPYSYSPYVYYPNVYYPSGDYQYGYYPYEYHHYHWYYGRHHLRRAIDWLF